MLEEINHWYWGNEEIRIVKTFYEKYEELKEFIEKNNKLPSSTTKNKIEKKLGIWCSNIRTEKRNKQLEEAIKKRQKENKEKQDALLKRRSDKKQKEIDEMFSDMKKIVKSIEDVNTIIFNLTQ